MPERRRRSLFILYALFAEMDRFRRALPVDEARARWFAGRYAADYRAQNGRKSPERPAPDAPPEADPGRHATSLQKLRGGSSQARECHPSSAMLRTAALCCLE